MIAIAALSLASTAPVEFSRSTAAVRVNQTERMSERPSTGRSEPTKAPGSGGDAMLRGRDRAERSAVAVTPPAPSPPRHEVPVPVAAQVPELPPVALLDLLADDAVPQGDPDAVAAPPGRAPMGDARSLRYTDRAGARRFAVRIRRGTAAISGDGALGRRGTWHVVEYPSVRAASRAYAQACSALIAAGYVDFEG